jgi:shikimate dehydrogenase
MTGIHAEVWGSPIGHSRSPDLHLAGYRHLQMSGSYERRDVTEASLAAEFATHSPGLTGISLTMPLKTGILDLVPDHRGDVEILGAANTAVNTDGQWWLANTDPLGAAAMLRGLLPDLTGGVIVVGAGATAKSIVMGLHRVAFSGQLTVVVRSAERAAGTLRLADSLGMAVEVVELDTPGKIPVASLVISTLPSGTTLTDFAVESLCRSKATLMDVGYHPWPTPLADAFLSRGLQAHSGLPMLMCQALGQIRAFVNGDQTVPLADEAGALRAMARAVGVDEVWADPALMGE